MPTIMTDLFFMFFASAIGSLGTWWLCRANSRLKPAPQANADAEEAAEVLARLQELATRVAVDVGDHSNQVEEIGEELTSGKEHDAVGIVNVVAKLVQVNQNMQDRLASTEDKLREQADQLQSHVVEARTDALTSLANRRAFDDEMARRLAEFQRHGRVLSVVMVDVDHFKRFNDTHGHQAGDKVLQGVARVFRQKTRAMDLVARYGGEEFSIVFPGTSLRDAALAATHVCEALEKSSFSFEGKRLQVTASFGVARLLGSEDAEGLVKRADTALYAAKEAGRNCVCVHDGKAAHLLRKDAHTGPAKKKAAVQAPDSQPRREEPDMQLSQMAAADEADTPASPKPVAGEAAGEPLTQTEFAEGLPNRMMFCQQVRNRLAEWKRGGPVFSIVLVEVDEYGQLLRQRDARSSALAWDAITKLAIATVREMDLVGRFTPGGLTLLLPGTESASAMRVAERLQQAVGEHASSADGGRLPFTASFGIVEVSDRDDSISLLKRVEAALDAARQQGGNCIYHHDGESCAPITVLSRVT